MHPAHVRAAVAAGVDTFCEKPLARTAAEAQELVDLADAAGVKLLPGHVVLAGGKERFPLRIAAEGTYLEDATGKPFLITGDSAWSLIADLPPEDADA